MSDFIFDIWDQVQVTELVTRAGDRVMGANRERIAGQFAPLVGTTEDKIAQERVKVRAVGKGRIIADDATPPIWRPKIKLVEEAWTIVRLAEMTPIEESLRRQLEINGSDADSVNRRKRAGVDIITRGRGLQVRNENQSDWMIMQAVNFGELPIQVANPPEGDTDTEYVIDYEFPPGHLATVSTSFADLTAGNPISVMRADQQLLKDDTGTYGRDFYFSSTVWNYILNSKQVRDSMTPSVGPQYIPTEEHVKNLLWEPQEVTFHITDDGWYDEDAGYDIELNRSKTRWVPEDRYLLTSPNQFGESFASMYDGMVPVQTDWNSYEYRGPGFQSYVQLIQGNLTLMLRSEARRMPMVHHPECIISRKVVL
jgi:hypothetical protein